MIERERERKKSQFKNSHNVLWSATADGAELQDNTNTIALANTWIRQARKKGDDAAITSLRGKWK